MLPKQYCDILVTSMMKCFAQGRLTFMHYVACAILEKGGSLYFGFLHVLVAIYIYVIFVF